MAQGCGADERDINGRCPDDPGYQGTGSFPGGDQPGGGTPPAGTPPGSDCTAPGTHLIYGPYGSLCVPDDSTRAEGASGTADASSFQMPEWHPFNFDFNFGDAPAFTARRFTAPKPEDILNDPSYKWRLGQSLEALQNSAAAKGVARTGNTAKGLVDYAGNAASQEYGSAFDRAMRVFQTDYQGDLDEYKPKLITYQTNAAGKQRAQELTAQEQWNKYLADLDWSKFLLTAPA